MRDRFGFDPVGSFLGICLTILIAAVLLRVAVFLLAAIWPWLLGLLLAVVVIGGLTRLFVVRRGQRW